MTSKRIISGHLQFVLALIACTAMTPAAHAQAKWVRLAPLPEPAEEILGAAAGGKMYVFAGLAPVWKPMGMVYEYDPASNQWTKKKPMALASHHVAFTEYHGRIYAFGGFVFPQSGPPAWVPINNAWEYDPAIDNWSAPRARMPTTRSALGAGTYIGRIYVAGGEFQDPHMMATFRSVEAFDPATNTWSIMPSMPVSRHGLAAGVLGNRLLLVGGDVQSSGTEIHASTSEVDALELPGMDK